MADFILPRVGILSFMDDDYRAQLTAHGQILPALPGQTVIAEGAEAKYLFIVISGTYVVTCKANDRDVHLDEIVEGDCLGEVAIFEPGRASATATCREEGQLWCMDSENLQQFLLESPHGGCALILGINTLLSRRLKRANATIKTNAIVPRFLSVRSRTRAATAA
jgi:CRP-like cAMP-binding protein